jgi:hypothetical protein
VDCFSGGSEPTIASPVPAATIAIAARYSILMVMVPPSVPRTNRILPEMVPQRCLTLALERLLVRRPEGILVEPRSIPLRTASSSMRRLGAPICFPFFPSERRHDQKSGNESSGQDIRSTRPSLAVNYTAHVADSQRFLLQGPLFSKTSARADSQKRRSPVPLRIASRARKRKSCGRDGRQRWRFLIRTRLRYAQPH